MPAISRQYNRCVHLLFWRGGPQSRFVFAAFLMLFCSCLSAGERPCRVSLRKLRSAAEGKCQAPLLCFFPQRCDQLPAPSCAAPALIAPQIDAPRQQPSVPPRKRAENQPEVVFLGYSVKGIPITMHVFGTEGRSALIFGAIHGDEENSGELARHLLDYLLKHPEAYAGRRVAVIPVANPDGLVKSKRQNDHQVDVNRNSPAANFQVSKPGPTFGGMEAASEPETRALMNAVEQLAPDRIVSIHAITRGRECNNYDGPGRELAEAMKANNGYRVTKSIGYPTPGSFGAWAGIDHQIPTITLELPKGLPGNDCWQIHRDALLAVITFQTEMSK